MISKLIKFSLYFLLFFLIFSEVLLRSIGYNYCPLKIEGLTKEVDGLGKTDWRPFHSSKDEFAEYDPYLIWRPKKNFWEVNSQGFPGEELTTHKEKEEYRIFALGDSNTSGLNHYNSAWPEHLEQLFMKNNHRNVKVVNAGVWGYSSFQGLRRFKNILSYNPDMVLISFGANDAQRVTIPDREYVSSKIFFEHISHLRICQLFIALSDRILLWVKKGDILIPRVSLKEYEKNIRQIISIAKKNNIKVVLLTRPFIGTSHHPLWWKNFAPEYNAQILKIAEQQNVIAIDIYQDFKDKEEYFINESHFNDAGHKIAAGLIYDKIKDIVPNF